MINHYGQVGAARMRKIGWERWHVLTMSVGKLFNIKLVTPRAAISIVVYLGKPKVRHAD